MRSARGARGEFSAFYATAYPELLAQRCRHRRRRPRRGGHPDALSGPSSAWPALTHGRPAAAGAVARESRWRRTQPVAGGGRWRDASTPRCLGDGSAVPAPAEVPFRNAGSSLRCWGRRRLVLSAVSDPPPSAEKSIAPDSPHRHPPLGLRRAVREIHTASRGPPPRTPACPRLTAPAAATPSAQRSTAGGQTRRAARRRQRRARRPARRRSRKPASGQTAALEPNRERAAAGSRCLGYDLPRSPARRLPAAPPARSAALSSPAHRVPVPAGTPPRRTQLPVRRRRQPRRAARAARPRRRRRRATAASQSPTSAGDRATGAPDD